MESKHQGNSQEGARGLQPITPFPAARLLAFDLDGTLIDSREDLILSVNAARAYMDLPPLPDDLIASYVGNGAPVLLRKAMGPEATDGQVATALDYFIRYYHDHCLDKTVLYPGSRETLQAAYEKKIQLAILTNKPVRISNVILDGLGVKDLFFQVYGGNSFPTKKPDPQGLRALMEESGSDAASTVMVGDSSVDIMTARNANVYAVGMSYGLQPESLREVPPDLLLDRMDDLIPHL